MTVRLTMNYTDAGFVREDVEDAILDINIAMEQKVDGTRCMVVIETKHEGEPEFRFLGRGGKKLTHAAAMLHFESIENALRPHFPRVGETVLDGEIMFDQAAYVLFDMPYHEVRGTTIVEPNTSYRERRQFLGAMAPFIESPTIIVSRTEWTPEGKAALWNEVQASGGEGVMLKHLDSPYEPGIRAKHSTKVKFVKTADVVIINCTRGRNEAGRETGNYTFGVASPSGSVTVETIDGPMKVHPLGAMSCIGKPQVDNGTVVEVSYLYRGAGGGLVQPRFMRPRTDKRPMDCTEEQFPIYSKAVVR